MVDDLPWPVRDGDTLWLPPGAPCDRSGEGDAGLRIVRLNAELQDARRLSANCVEFAYESTARAIAVLDRRPLKLSLDGREEPLELAGPNTVLLPRGQHLVTITSE